MYIIREARFEDACQDILLTQSRLIISSLIVCKEWYLAVALNPIY